MKGEVATVSLASVLPIDDGQCRRGDGIYPRTSQPEMEGQSILQNRTFHIDTPGRKSQRQCTMILSWILLPRPDIDDRREPSSVTCREAALVEIDLLDSIRIEGRE